MNLTFKLDYKRLIVQLLPTSLRKPTLFRLLKASAQPLVTMHDAFLASRKQNLYVTNQTGQVCYLRGLLNDTFDPELRRLYITCGETSDWMILYKKSLFTAPENKHPSWLRSADEKKKKTLLFRNEVKLVPKKGSISAAGVDFIIMIPIALRGIVDENRVISLVNFYKLASKRYIIQYYQNNNR